MMNKEKSYNNLHFLIFFSENDKNPIENVHSWKVDKEVLQKHSHGE